jgi:hypothetical protein
MRDLNTDLTINSIFEMLDESKGIRFVKDWDKDKSWSEGKRVLMYYDKDEFTYVLTARVILESIRLLQNNERNQWSLAKFVFDADNITEDDAFKIIWRAVIIKQQQKRYL